MGLWTGPGPVTRRCLALVLVSGVAAGCSEGQLRSTARACDAEALRRGPAELEGSLDHIDTELLQLLPSVDTSLEPGKFALMISALGMNSHYGSGVRQMAMMMDLQSCGFGVDTLTDNPLDMLDWSSPLAIDVLNRSSNFHVTSKGQRSSFNAKRALRLMQRYDRIIFFGWAWEMELAAVATVALKAFEADPSLRSKVTLVMDDNPFHRCYGERELSYCRERAPAMLSRWLNVSRYATAISKEDAEDLNKVKAMQRIPGPDFTVWPLHLDHVQSLFTQGVVNDDQSVTEPVLTMVANAHSENVKFVSTLVKDGHLARICKAGNNAPKKLKLVFVGKIAAYMQTTFKHKMDVLQQSCVKLVEVVSNDMLENEIIPRSMALLNPFLESIQSGISVKTFEAIATNKPIVTSLPAFRGLEECGRRLDQAGLLAPADAAAYVDFIVEHFVDSNKSSSFVRQQRAIMHDCLVEQMAEPNKCS